MPSPVGATPNSMGTLKRILDAMTSPSSGFVSGAVSAWLMIPAIRVFCTLPFRGYGTLRVAVWRWLLLVDPRIFWVPGLAAGLGCVVCPGVVREPSTLRASLGALARCPARPCGPSGALYAGGGGFALHEAFWGCVVGVSDPHVVQFPPRLAVVRPRREAVRSPNCRPIGRKQSKIGYFEAMGLHFGGFGVNRGVLLAREPLNMHVDPLIRTSTPRHACGRGRLHAGHRVNVRVKGPACAGYVHRNRRGPDGSQASRRSPCVLGYDGGGTPKGPASRCGRWLRCQH